MKRIDGGTLQDLHHYALAMQGNGDSAFDCHTLKARLEAAEGVYRLLTCLDVTEPNVGQWDPYIKESWRSETELRQVGRKLLKHVARVSKIMGIDSRTGERISGNV